MCVVFSCLIHGSCGVLILNKECYYLFYNQDPKVNHLTRNLLASLRWIFFLPSKDFWRKCISMIGKGLIYSRFFFTVILTLRKLPNRVWQSEDKWNGLSLWTVLIPLILFKLPLKDPASWAQMSLQDISPQGVYIWLGRLDARSKLTDMLDQVVAHSVRGDVGPILLSDFSWFKESIVLPCTRSGPRVWEPHEAWYKHKNRCEL